MSLPVFITCDEAKQITELKIFLKSKGAKSLDVNETSKTDWIKDLKKCIHHISICWKEDSVKEADADDIFTTVTSLILSLPPDQLKEVIDLLCNEYESCSSDHIRKHFFMLLSLNVIYSGLPLNNKCRYRVYFAIISCAAKRNSLQQIVTDPKKVNEMLDECECTVDERRDLWRKLHEVQLACGETKRAIETMILLLSTYDERSAAKAREDAIKCIISVIQDSALLAHEQLLCLKPIQFLEGEPVYMLLKIFVSGSLKDLTTFIEKNPGFFKQNGLCENACLNKIRILTLMQMAENSSELDYTVVAKELKLQEDQLECFVIEAVRQRVISCKLDQVQRRVIVTGSLPRSFGVAQWRGLYETLCSWRTGLGQVQSSLALMVRAGEAAPMAGGVAGVNTIGAAAGITQ